jgi:hypothetical protein
MKHILLGACALMIAFGANAQKVQDTDITYDYTRLPSEPVSKDIKNYQSKVVLTYAGTNDDIMAEYTRQCRDIKEKNEKDCAEANKRYEMDKASMAQRRADAQKNYEMEMQVYKEQDALAEERYQKELAAWNEKSGAGKFLSKQLMEEQKPQKAYVSKPTLQLPTDPYAPICPDPVYPPKPDLKDITDPSVLSSSYLKLDGFKNLPDNAVKVEVTMHAFENTEPELKSTVSKDKDGRVVSTTYWYETSAKKPMNVKVTKPDGSAHINESLEQFANMTMFKTKSGSSPSAIMTDKKSYLKKLEDDLIAKNLNQIDSMLDSRVGYTAIKRTTTLYSVETGKMNYDDYKKAYDAAFIGYNKLTSDPAAAKAKLNEAIAIWEKALIESNPEDKKARIDKDVTIVTLVNIVEALIFVDEYGHAEDHMIKLKSMDLSRREKRAVEELDKLLESQKARYTANN